MKREYSTIKVTGRTQSTICTKERQWTTTMCGLQTIEQHYNQGPTSLTTDQ